MREMTVAGRRSIVELAYRNVLKYAIGAGECQSELLMMWSCESELACEFGDVS